VRRDGIFIAVEVADGTASDASLVSKLSEACPVDIYAQRRDGSLEILEQNLDECVLCRLCLEAAPAGTVSVLKRYDHDAPLI
jgi:ferredoxin-like protein FixX